MEFKEIKKLLTGFARIEVFGKGDKNIKSIFEGEMVEGHYHGYGRRIYIAKEIEKKTKKE